MKQKLLLLLLSLFPLLSFAQECTITWELKGMSMIAISGEGGMTFLDSGDKVPKGTTITLAPSCKPGYQLGSFIVNGVDVTDDLQDYSGSGRDFQYGLKVNEDTHIEAIGKIAEYIVKCSVKGGGQVKMTYEGKPFYSGDLVKFEGKITVQAIPDEGQTCKKLIIDDQDCTRFAGDPLDVGPLYHAISIEATFSGDDKPENQEKRVLWTAEGDGTLSVKTAEGREVKSGETVAAGTELTITSIPNEGAELKKFTVDGYSRITELTENGGEFTTTVKEAISIYAKFSGSSTTNPEEGGLWLDKAASEYAGGSGTQEAPYLIETPEQLALLAKQMDEGNSTEGLYYKQIKDIDLRGNVWFPIGYMSMTKGNKFFEGHFDGNGFGISNLTIQQQPEITTSGLFGATNPAAEVRNVTITSGDVYNEMIVGAIVGYNRGLIENCVNRASVSCGVMYCGGIAASNSKVDGQTAARIVRCVNYGAILAGTGNNGMNAAGIVASSQSIVEECANYGKIDSKTGISGGIVALMEGGKVSNCYNRGAIYAPEQVGGVVGTANGRVGACEIYNCYSASNVSGSQGVGAVFGETLYTVENAFKADRLYYDADLCNADTYGNADDYFGTFELGEFKSFTSEEMKAQSFVDKLNEGNSGSTIWYMDSQNANNGYPVFVGQTTGIYAATATNDNVQVYAQDGKLCIEGCPAQEPVMVYGITGTLAFRGTASSAQNAQFVKGLYVVKVAGNSYKVSVR